MKQECLVYNYDVAYLKFHRKRYNEEQVGELLNSDLYHQLKHNVVVRDLTYT